MSRPFPHYFDKGNTHDFEDVAPVQQEEVNSEDEDINVQDSSNFNGETGLWNFKSLSTHKPFKNSMDPGLIFGTQQRNDLVNSSNIDIDSGVYKELDLKPCVNGKICPCGELYVQEMYVGVSTVYCQMGPLQCKCYSYKCPTKTCTLSYEEVARERGIFFYSSKTTAGDEIGHDFISLVKKAKISFTSFCNEMTRQYVTNNIHSGKFMSPNTFIKCKLTFANILTLGASTTPSC